MERFGDFGNQFLLHVRKEIAVIVVPVLSFTEDTADRNHGVIGIGGNLGNEVFRNHLNCPFPVNEPLFALVNRLASQRFSLHIILVEGIQFRLKTETGIGKSAHEVHHIRPVHVAGTGTACDEIIRCYAEESYFIVLGHRQCCGIVFQEHNSLISNLFAHLGVGFEIWRL